MAARVHRGSPEAAAPTPIRYQGLVTRGIAFVLDAALINLVALVVGIAAALILSILSLPESLNPALGALGALSFVVWTVAYFTLFWASTGQTPGNRVMEIRVVTADGGMLKPRRALFRFGALVLAALPVLPGLPADPADRAAPRPAGHAGAHRGGGRAGPARPTTLRPAPLRMVGVS